MHKLSTVFIALFMIGFTSTASAQTVGSDCTLLSQAGLGSVVDTIDANGAAAAPQSTWKVIIALPNGDAFSSQDPSPTISLPDSTWKIVAATSHSGAAEPVTTWKLMSRDGNTIDATSAQLRLENGALVYDMLFEVPSATTNEPILVHVTRAGLAPADGYTLSLFDGAPPVLCGPHAH